MIFLLVPILVLLVFRRRGEKQLHESLLDRLGRRPGYLLRDDAAAQALERVDLLREPLGREDSARVCFDERPHPGVHADQVRARLFEDACGGGRCRGFAG